jgi:phage/plasmid-like protein (TIGR03299 family)
LDNIAKINGKESFAYVGEAAWHGKGQLLTEGADIETWAREGGLDWHAITSPVMYAVDGKLYQDNKNHVVYRSDNRMPLHVVSARWKCVQPRDMLTFFESLISDLGFHLHTAGALQQGKRIFASARVGEGFRIAGIDKIDPYLMFCTSFDNSLSTFVRFTAVRPVCENTVMAALAGKTSGEIIVRHNSVFNADRVKAELGLTLESWNSFTEAAAVLAKANISAKFAVNFIDDLVGMSDDPANNAKSKQLGKILDLFNGEGKGSNLATANGTMWGLLNAVTEYVDHHAPARTSENRFNSALFGNGNNLKSEALRKLLATV